MLRVNRLATTTVTIKEVPINIQVNRRAASYSLEATCTARIGAAGIQRD